MSRLHAAVEEDKSILRQLVGQLSDEKRCLQRERDSLKTEVEELKERVQVRCAVLVTCMEQEGKPPMPHLRVLAFGATLCCVAGARGRV